MMTSYFDLLKYAATGQASPSMTYYDKMRASALMGGSAQTLTGQPPLSFKSDGTPLISWSMKGNGVQSGTPTPDSPVMPEFVGTRTGNLFDGAEYVNTSISSIERWEYSLSLTGSVYRVPCKPSTTYTLYLTENIDLTIWRIRDVSTDAVPNAQSTSVPLTGAYTSSVPASKSTTFTTSSNAKYILFQTNGSAYASVLRVIMLVEGTTKIPYEPYGWAEKITCAGQTTTVYLGQVSTVRKIRKLVLDGTENITLYTIATGNLFRTELPAPRILGQFADAGMCTHYRTVTNAADRVNGTISGGNSAAVQRFVDIVDNYTTAADFKSYLAAQYAAGNPVTVWYVLAEQTTGIVNEPLAKIGDYADELRSEDAGVSIPTVKGSNTLTVETELQPSEMTIKYRG